MGLLVTQGLRLAPDFSGVILQVAQVARAGQKLGSNEMTSLCFKWQGVKVVIQAIMQAAEGVESAVPVLPEAMGEMVRVLATQALVVMDIFRAMEQIKVLQVIPGLAVAVLLPVAGALGRPEEMAQVADLGQTE